MRYNIMIQLFKDFDTKEDAFRFTKDLFREDIYEIIAIKEVNYGQTKGTQLG